MLGEAAVPGGLSSLFSIQKSSCIWKHGIQQDVTNASMATCAQPGQRNLDEDGDAMKSKTPETGLTVSVKDDCRSHLSLDLGRLLVV